MWGTFGPQIQCNTQKIRLEKFKLLSTTIGGSWIIPTRIVHDFHMEEYVEYQEKRAFHCLHARADIPSGVQKYPKATK